MRFFTGLHKPSDDHRFDEKFIEKLESRISLALRAPELGECWEWQGAKNSRGYGQSWFGEKVVYVHRASLEIVTGKALGSLRSCHRCDNPACLRPDHLFAGTQMENLQDMIKKERNQYGETHGMAKLTQAQVDDMRARHAAGESYRTLASEYGVHPFHASDVIRGASWKKRSKQV